MQMWYFPCEDNSLTFTDVSFFPWRYLGLVTHNSFRSWWGCLFICTLELDMELDKKMLSTISIVNFWRIVVFARCSLYIHKYECFPCAPLNEDTNKSQVVNKSINDYNKKSRRYDLSLTFHSFLINNISSVGLAVLFSSCCRRQRHRTVTKTTNRKDRKYYRRLHLGLFFWLLTTCTERTIRGNFHLGYVRK